MMTVYGRSHAWRTSEVIDEVLRDLARLGDPLTADPAALVEEVRAEATSESILPFEALQTRDHT